MKPVPLILVVDDEPDICALVHYHLARSSYRVRMANDGVAALASIDEQTPDLMVLDLMLPGMTGWDVLRELRRHPKHAALPVVLLSARREDEEDRSAAVRLGAADYITKPFSPGELVQRIESTLGRVLHRRGERTPLGFGAQSTHFGTKSGFRPSGSLAPTKERS